MSKNINPFAFKPYDEKMKKENAANYIPPTKRKAIKEFLSNSSISLREGNTGFDGVTQYAKLMSNSKAVENDGKNRPSPQALKKERADIKAKQTKGHMLFGHDDNFHKITSDNDLNKKVPANYKISTLGEMTKTSKDHHYNLGMRPHDPSIMQQQKNAYEEQCRDLMQDRINFLNNARSTQQRIRKSSFQLAHIDGKRLNQFSNIGANITPRIGNGDIHFHRSNERIAADSNTKLLQNQQKLEKKPLDIETGFHLDKFGKKMNAVPKDSFQQYEHNRSQSGIKIDMDYDKKIGAKRFSQVGEGPSKQANANTQSNVDLKNPQQRNLTISKYDKFQFDQGRAGEAQPNKDYKEYRNINLHQLNLPLRDNVTQFPKDSVSNENLKVGAAVESPKGLTKDKSLGSLQNLHDKISSQQKSAITIGGIKRDSFYKRGGTYNSIFTEETSKIEPKSFQTTKNQYYQQLHLNQKHHKTALLGINYKDIYNKSDGRGGQPSYPQYNSYIPAKQSSKNSVYSQIHSEFTKNKVSHQGNRNILIGGTKPREGSRMSEHYPAPQGGTNIATSPQASPREEFTQIRDESMKVGVKLGFDNSSSTRNLSISPSAQRLTSNTQMLVKKFSPMDNSAQQIHNKQIYDNNKLKQFKSSTFASSAHSSIHKRLGSLPAISNNKEQYKWNVPKYDV